MTTMVLGFLKYQFAGLWPLLWHFGLGGVIVIVCGLLYAFTPAPLAALFPNVRKILLWVASIVVAIMISTAIGVTLGEKRIQAQWDQARANAVETGKQARAHGVQDAARAGARAARKPSRVLPAYKDRDLRD